VSHHSHQQNKNEHLVVFSFEKKIRETVENEGPKVWDRNEAAAQNKTWMKQRRQEEK